MLQSHSLLYSGGSAVKFPGSCCKMRASAVASFKRSPVDITFRLRARRVYMIAIMQFEQIKIHFLAITSNGVPGLSDFAHVRVNQLSESLSCLPICQIVKC